MTENYYARDIEAVPERARTGPQLAFFFLHSRACSLAPAGSLPLICSGLFSLLLLAINIGRNNEAEDHCHGLPESAHPWTVFCMSFLWWADSAYIFLFLFSYPDPVCSLFISILLAYFPSFLFFFLTPIKYLIKKDQTVGRASLKRK